MKISVIVPAYNCQSYIKKCIDSILRQSGVENEIVVVNDGSTDGTLGILKEYGDKIKLIDIENGGVANARNTGLKNATGDYIMFVDSDDEMGEGCIATVSQRLTENPVDILRFEYLVCQNGVKKKPLHYISEEKLVEKPDFKREIYPEFIKGMLLNSLWVHCINRRILEGITFPSNLKTAEDAFFSLNAYSRARNALFITDEFYIYNRVENSLTGGGLSLIEKYRCNFLLSFEILRHLKDWGMNSIYWKIRTLFRPVVLTIDKLKRSKK